MELRSKHYNLYVTLSNKYRAWFVLSKGYYLMVFICAYVTVDIPHTSLCLTACQGNWTPLLIGSQVLCCSSAGILWRHWLAPGGSFALTWEMGWYDETDRSYTVYILNFTVQCLTIYKPLFMFNNYLNKIIQLLWSRFKTKKHQPKTIFILWWSCDPNKIV